MRRWLPLLGLWGVLATVLALLTTSVADWYALPNELLYERRAIEAALGLSPLPHLRGEAIASWDQLYPLLIAPAFRSGFVADDLLEAHLLNAWVMSSACIPVFLLARRVTGRTGAAYVVAALSVFTPWIVLASFLLTEVAAYPAFAWAALAVQRTIAAPSRRSDALALLAVGAAFLARTQLVVLLAILPAAIVAYETGRARGDSFRARAAAGLRASAGPHRLLVWAYGALAAAALAVAAAGRLPGTLGVYGAAVGGEGSETAEGLSAGELARSFAEHFATVSLGLGILPFVLGLGWLLAGLVRPPAGRDAHAFACLGSILVVTLLAQVTVFDVRFGLGFVHDRYLLYVVPLLLVAVAAAILGDGPLPRWSLAPSAALVALGFAIGEIPGFTWEQFETLDVETPASALYRPFADLFGGLTGARVLLALATVLLTAGFVAGAALLRRSHLVAAVAVFLLLVPPLATGYLFSRLLETDGWASRPLTGPPEGLYDWVDRTVGTGADVAMVPFPVSSAYLVNQRAWRDYEFWNKSVGRDVQLDDRSFLFTGTTFPKTFLAFDPESGAADASPARYALQAHQESRFRIAGPIVATGADAFLVDAEQPWRAEWLSSGLYADGWTMPGTEARVRVFVVPGQRGAVVRKLTFGFRALEDAAGRPVEIATNSGRWSAAAEQDTVRATVDVCVPAGGFADATLRADGVSEIDGDLRYLDPPAPRLGGVLVSQVALADEIGPACVPRRP